MINDRQMGCNYGVGFINPNDQDENGDVTILHMVLMEQPPDDDMVQHLWDEIATDEEFGLAEIVDELEMIELPDEIINDIKQRMSLTNDVETKDHFGDEDG